MSWIEELRFSILSFRNAYFHGCPPIPLISSIRVKPFSSFALSFLIILNLLFTVLDFIDSFVNNRTQQFHRERNVEIIS